jgi:hypothetical protein
MELHLAQEIAADMQVLRVHVLQRFENKASPVSEVFNIAHIQKDHKFIKNVTVFKESIGLQSSSQHWKGLADSSLNGFMFYSGPCLTKRSIRGGC